MVQWIRLRAPNVGDEVQALVGELDPMFTAQLTSVSPTTRRSDMQRGGSHALQLRPGTAKINKY